MSVSRIRWMGFLLLVLMAVRVSITPGLQHRHPHGDRPHAHHHGRHHHHHHSHPHEHEHHGQAAESHTHIHISILGWELILSTPWLDEQTAETPLGPTVADGKEVDVLPGQLHLQSAGSWGLLIQWLLDIRSPAPSDRLQAPQGNFITALDSSEPGGRSRDRDRPALPPPEDVPPRPVIR